MSPCIGLTADLSNGQYRVSAAYAQQVRAAGGTPIVLPCEPLLVESYLSLLDGLLLTGGDDPAVEAWGQTTDPRIRPVHPRRQTFEEALLAAVGGRDLPVLGVCLGMQMMGLVAGGRLEQHLPDVLPTAEDHLNGSSHPVEGSLGTGEVHSHHRQALSAPGRLAVVARAPDGVIEAIADEDRPFYIGVQWHPERTADPALGHGLFERLVSAAAAGVRRSESNSPADRSRPGYRHGRSSR